MSSRPLSVLFDARRPTPSWSLGSSWLLFAIQATRHPSGPSRRSHSRSAISCLFGPPLQLVTSVVIMVTPRPPGCSAAPFWLVCSTTTTTLYSVLCSTLYYYYSVLLCLLLVCRVSLHYATLRTTLRYVCFVGKSPATEMRYVIFCYATELRIFNMRAADCYERSAKREAKFFLE